MKYLLLPLVLAAFISMEVHAESFTISDIRINGLQRVSAGSVFAALPIRIGDQVDEASLADASKALFRAGYFQDIRLSRSGNVLLVTVVERPSVASIDISGNKAIKTEDLLKGLRQAGLAEGEIFQRVTLERVRNELLRQYVAQGRYSADIETEVISEPRNRVRLKININEGVVASISHINVVGNTVFPDETLINLFELKTKKWYRFFSSADKYSREKLSGDLERLRSYYMDRGYVNMDIASTQVSITPDKKSVYITVNIEEGDKYRIREVKMEGDLKLPEETLRSLLLVQNGQVFSRKLMVTSSELLSRRLGNDGYAFADVRGIPETHPEDHTVSITFIVDPGKRVYVNRINYRGNTKTEDVVLRREMRQMEGGWASTYLIDQSKTRLERLGYFKEVKVETAAVPGTDDQVDVNYTVEEQPSGSISASVGFAQSSGLVLGGSIKQDNFLGTGNKVGIGMTRSDYQTNINFSYLNPYWTVDGVSLGYNVFYRTTDYDKLDVDYTSYSVDSLGAGFSFGYPISETSSVSYGLTVQNDKVKPGNASAAEVYHFTDKYGTNYLNYKLNLGWGKSTLNRGLLPTRGASQTASVQIAIPGSDLTFYKIDYSAQYFKPITDNYILRFHTDLGYGDGYGSTNMLPFYENYYAGGYNSVRGFKDGSLGPRSTPSYRYYNPYYDDWNDDDDPFGGNILITGGVELIVPTPFVNDQRTIRTALFWDAGNVFSNNCPLSTTKNCKNPNFGDLASSVGIGVTWVTAFGPLSFSLAMPVKKPDNADTQIFQFSLGQTF
ncbi:outer membrane protein assembly factor BamA [Entomomonas asaccharolytica]|uniref:Outer membrane protein assembly factor BamA n=1 Tax=Entomomonas asaccharolytica TaxID=2785331 RepID=A0A974RWX4_9GAMM|nr:outer membrane protein assembly factor BamA [Entomomonas asaccharolytica]QQP85597.1 outer membrane protein assembly factor BamA [Entomomonas asaccharolytica]